MDVEGPGSGLDDGLDARGGGARAGRGAIVSRREGHGRLRRGLEGVVDVQADDAGNTLDAAERLVHLRLLARQRGVHATLEVHELGVHRRCGKRDGGFVLRRGAVRLLLQLALPAAAAARGRVAELGAHHAVRSRRARARGCVARGGEETHT